MVTAVKLVWEAEAEEHGEQMFRSQRIVIPGVKVLYFDYCKSLQDGKFYPIWSPVNGVDTEQEIQQLAQADFQQFVDTLLSILTE